MKPTTDLSRRVILKYTDIHTSVRMAKWIKWYRPIHQRKWPVIQKVEFSCPILMECDVDGKKFNQQAGQSDEDYFEMIQKEVLKEEHRILELVVNPNVEGWYHRMPVFSELPFVKKFTFLGLFTSREKANLFFKGLSPFECSCPIGESAVLSMDPFKNARALEIELIVGNIRTMPPLRFCQATHWRVIAAIHEDYDDDWVLERFASGIMEVGSEYKVIRKSTDEPAIQIMLDTMPHIVWSEQRIGKETYSLDLNNGTMLVVSVVEKNKKRKRTPVERYQSTIPRTRRGRPRATDPFENPRRPTTLRERVYHLKIVDN